MLGYDVSKGQIKNILKNRFLIVAILVYVAFIFILRSMHNYKVYTVGYYSIFIPVWLGIAVLIVLSYLILVKVIKLVVYSFLALGLLLFFSGHKLLSLTMFGPAAIIVSLLIIFFISFIISLSGIGLIFAYIFGLATYHFTHSAFLVAVAAIFGFIFGLSLAYAIYTMIVFPFSYGFSLSLIAANIASVLASAVFFVNFIPHYSIFLYHSGMDIVAFLKVIADYIKFLIENQLLIFIGSIVVGVITVIVNFAHQKSQTKTQEKTQ